MPTHAALTFGRRPRAGAVLAFGRSSRVTADALSRIAERPCHAVAGLPDLVHHRRPRRRSAGAARQGVPHVSDDPYAWLEDVTGERSLTWVKRAQRQVRGRAGDHAAVQAARSRHPRHPRFRRQDPGRREDRRRTTTTSGRTSSTSAACGAAPRWRSTARPSRAWETVHRPRRAQQGRGRELGLARRRLPASPPTTRCLIALSRGGADADVTREFDLADEALGEGRLLPPRGQGRAAAGSTATRSTSSPTSAPAR